MKCDVACRVRERKKEIEKKKWNQEMKQRKQADNKMVVVQQ